MLAHYSNSIKWLALAGWILYLTLVGSNLGSHAAENSSSNSGGGGDHLKVPAIPSGLPKEFRETLDKLMGPGKEDVKDMIYRYFILAPSSHRSRSLIYRINWQNSQLSPHGRRPAVRGHRGRSPFGRQPGAQSQYLTTTTTTTKQPQQQGGEPERDAAALMQPPPVNPMMDVVEMIAKEGKCDSGECPIELCSLIVEHHHSREAAAGNQSSPAESHCPPCPVADFCLPPGPCGKCQPAPKCPCGDEPVRLATESGHPLAMNETAEREMAAADPGQPPTRWPKPPRWPTKPTRPTKTTPKTKTTTTKASDASTTTTTTTTKKATSTTSTKRTAGATSTTKQSGSTTTTTPRAGVSSTTTKGTQSSTTTKASGPSTSTTTTTKKPAGPSTTTTKKSGSTTTTTTTKKTQSTTTTKATGSSSTTSTSTTKKSTPSTTTTTTTTNKPGSSSTTKKATTAATTTTTTKRAGGSSTTTKKATAAATTTTKPNGLKTTRFQEIRNQTSEQTTYVDELGKKSQFREVNSTISLLTYEQQLESGLKVLIKNETIVRHIMDSLRQLPVRAGGIEGRLAGRILQLYGSEQQQRQLRAPGAGHERAMTYGTLRNNMAQVMGHVVGDAIRNKCLGCEQKCKQLLKDNPPPACPAAADSAGGQHANAPTTTTTTTTTRKPSSSTSSSTSTTTTTTTTHKPGKKVCPPCEKRLICPAPAGCPAYQCKRCDAPEANQPQQQQQHQDKHEPGNGHNRALRLRFGSKIGSKRTTTTTTSTTTTSKPSKRVAHDPDFEVGFEPKWLPPRGENTSDYHLDDLDPVNPVKEEERFKRKQCKGRVCEFRAKCGAAQLNELTSKTKESGYIVNGEDSKYGEWPSYAKIEITKLPLLRSLCGGVLISDSHVLTAGHCVRVPSDGYGGAAAGSAQNQTPPQVLDAESLTVVIGDHERDSEDEFESRHAVEKVCFSSKFYDMMGDGSRYDFAILTLKEKVQFNDHVQPACLPFEPFPLGRAKCFAIGQGMAPVPGTDYLAPAKIVQKLPVGRRSCADWGFADDDRSRWCFSKRNGPGDSCSGDSGGPILCRSNKNRWTVMGLVSYGSERCDGAEMAGWIGVYTRLPALVDQILADCNL